MRGLQLPAFRMQEKSICQALPKLHQAGMLLLGRHS
jgi:hypothetical protein